MENQNNINMPEDQPKAKRTFEGTRASLPKKKGKKIIAFIIIIFLIMLSALSTFAFIEYKKTKQIEAKCSSEKDGSFVKTAAIQFSEVKYKELDNTASEIKKIKNYQNYPNCNYIVAINALNFGNIQEAKKMTEKLKNLNYNNISQLLKAETNDNTLEYINKKIENLEIVKKLNTTNFPEVDISKGFDE